MVTSGGRRQYSSSDPGADRFSAPSPGRETTLRCPCTPSVAKLTVGSAPEPCVISPGGPLPSVGKASWCACRLFLEPTPVGNPTEASPSWVNPAAPHPPPPAYGRQRQCWT